MRAVEKQLQRIYRLLAKETDETRQKLYHQLALDLIKRLNLRFHFQRTRN